MGAAFQLPEAGEHCLHSSLRQEAQTCGTARGVEIKSTWHVMREGQDVQQTNQEGQATFDSKHDGRQKARLVAGGHLTETSVDPDCSSVVSLRGMRLLTFIAELNSSEFWATDIGKLGHACLVHMQGSLHRCLH